MITRRTRQIFGLVAAIYAVYLFLVLAEGLSEDLMHVGTADPAWQFPYYFTNQSNILLLIWMVIFSVANLGQGALAERAGRLVNQAVATGLTLYMVVVFVIVACILNSFYSAQFEPVPSGGSLYLHVISPMLMLAIYLLYPWRGQATWRTVLAWMAYLFLYVILANVVGTFARWADGTQAYPYNFLNPHNYPGVALYLATIVGLSLAVFLVGCGLLRMKRRFDAEVVV